MAGLRYREDVEEVRARRTTWWNGGQEGRPALQNAAPAVGAGPRARPGSGQARGPAPTRPRDFAYRVHLSAVACINTHYLGEAVPAVSPDLAPNCLALTLGCQGVEMPGTCWCRPCFERPEEARFAYDPGNFYWQFSLRLGREQLRLGRGKCLIHIPAKSPAHAQEILQIATA